jgi:excisionase family DNA binding protein
VKVKRLPAGENFTVNELAAFLKVGRGKVLEWIEEGEIRVAYDLRGAGSPRSLIRIPRRVVIEFLESRRAAATSKGGGRLSK